MQRLLFSAGGQKPLLKTYGANEDVPIDVLPNNDVEQKPSDSNDTDDTRDQPFRITELQLHLRNTQEGVNIIRNNLSNENSRRCSPSRRHAVIACIGFLAAGSMALLSTLGVKNDYKEEGDDELYAILAGVLFLLSTGMLIYSCYSRRNDHANGLLAEDEKVTKLTDDDVSSIQKALAVAGRSNIEVGEEKIYTCLNALTDTQRNIQSVIIYRNRLMQSLAKAEICKSMIEIHNITPFSTLITVNL